jgi:hypothetical protein
MVLDTQATPVMAKDVISDQGVSRSRSATWS